MRTTVDARGLACPQPVIQTRKAMEQADQVVTLVDNETSRANVSRMAERAGWQVDVTPDGDDFCISLTKGGAAPQSEPRASARGHTGPVTGLAPGAWKEKRGSPSRATPVLWVN